MKELNDYIWNCSALEAAIIIFVVISVILWIIEELRK